MLVTTRTAENRGSKEGRGSTDGLPPLCWTSRVPAGTRTLRFCEDESDVPYVVRRQRVLSTSSHAKLGSDRGTRKGRPATTSIPGSTKASVGSKTVLRLKQSLRNTSAANSATSCSTDEDSKVPNQSRATSVSPHSTAFYSLSAQTSCTANARSVCVRPSLNTGINLHHHLPGCSLRHHAVVRRLHILE